MKTKGKISDNSLVVIHSLFILFTFAVAIFMPFYLGLLLIIVHKGHEVYFGDCYLTMLQKEYGYSDLNDDFFYHILNNKLDFEVNKDFTMGIHLAIKTIVALIVAYKAYLFFF